MATAASNEYNLDNVYKAFNNVIDPNDKLIRLKEFVIAFRELAK